ncbi:MAG: cation transporter [Candidatus Nanopelagicales bacterium]
MTAVPAGGPAGGPIDGPSDPGDPIAETNGETNGEASLRETRALQLSAAAALVLATVGIVWGLAVQSQVILFDGLYSIIGFVLSWFGLRASALVEAGPTQRYPFGREALAPLVVAIQAIVLAGTFAYASIDAVGVILAGGGDTELGPALVYSVLTLAASIGMRAVLARRAQGSDLVAAEVAQWAASVVLGVALVVGFGLALAIRSTSLSGLAPFVDPVLVLVAAVLILPTPVRMLRQSFRELLEGTPGPEVTDPIHAAIAQTQADFALPAPTIRIGKLGRKVYIELDFLVGVEENWAVDDADRIRRRLMTDLAQPGRLLWVNVELHTDAAWDG